MLGRKKIEVLSSVPMESDLVFFLRFVPLDLTNNVSKFRNILIRIDVLFMSANKTAPFCS